MFGLPENTALERVLPKKKIFEAFSLKSSEQTAFDKDISRIVIINVLSPSTIPAIAPFSDNASIFVIQLSLKRREFSKKNVQLIAKLIPQKLVFALTYEDSVLFAICNADKMFYSSWLPIEQAKLPLIGMSMENVWTNFITCIGNFSIDEGRSLDEQVAVNDKRQAMQDKIKALERQRDKECQPKKKLELHRQINELKNKLKQL